MANQELRHQPVAVKTFFDAVGNSAQVVGKRKTVTAEAAKSLLADGSLTVPHALQVLLERFDGATHHRLLDAVNGGIAKYERAHGFAPDARFIESALYAARAASMPLAELGVTGMRLDNATNNHHDQLSLQPAQAMVSIMAQFAESIPYAAYLPADVKSNEARLAIMRNEAQSDFGEYLIGASLDGIAGGGNYFDSERVCLLSANGGGGTALTFVVTQKASLVAGGTAAGAGNVAMPLLRGRTVLMVNGLPAGRETANYGTGSNTIGGQVTIAGTNYVLSGTVNSDTGAISVTSAPALPAGTVLEALAYIDFEKAPDFAPKVGTDVTVYSMFARESRGIMKSTIGAQTQMQSELGLDPRGQAMVSLRAQYAMERFYRANAKMKRVAANLTAPWNYDYAAQIAQKDRAQIWLNLAPVLAGASQEMANRNNNHGITTLFLTGELSAQARGLPRDIWEPSGLVDRPGIYRLGRLFGQYDCYYTPRGLTETGGGATSEILAVGRATDTARNPIVLGDAVPATMLPLAMNGDMVTVDGFYTRNFTEVNPHLQSAQGAALIPVTNIK